MMPCQVLSVGSRAVTLHKSQHTVSLRRSSPSRSPFTAAPLPGRTQRCFRVLAANDPASESPTKNVKIL
jgi:hypothetical protein